MPYNERAHICLSASAVCLYACLLLFLLCAEAATELGPQRREQSGLGWGGVWWSESEGVWEGGLPRDVALGFSVPPRCATVFNDNMVAQAVAAPLRK